MSSSLVSGPYASAVSIKFTPSSTARLRTLSAFSRSGGQPQIRSPVMRIAPKPSRLTGRSAPNFQSGFVAGLLAAEDVAPEIAPDPPAKSAAPPARAVPRNVRRLTPRFCIASQDSSAMTRTLRSRKPLLTQARYSAWVTSHWRARPQISLPGRCLLLTVGEREALRLFPACLAFLNVVPALAVSHKASTLTLSPPVPSGFAARR
jgi:hypothetical protein